MGKSDASLKELKKEVLSSDFKERSIQRCFGTTEPETRSLLISVLHRRTGMSLPIIKTSEVFIRKKYVNEKISMLYFLAAITADWK